MKLEPKHIITYLPHNVLVKYKDIFSNRYHKAYLTGVSRTDGIETTYKRKKDGCSGDYIHWVGRNSVVDLEFKLILHPLSGFAGKRTAGDVKSELNCSLAIVKELWEYITGDKTLEEISYGLYLVMCKNHIDFFRLIEEGLAIDINTIEK